MSKRRRTVGWWPRMDAFDWTALALLALLSVWFLAVLLSRAGPDRIWTGTDGLLPGDQQQYLAWIRLAAHDVLISDPYRLEPSAASFLHPGLVISGSLQALGVSPPVAYLLWKPVAVVALFSAVRAYVRTLVAGRWARRAALVLSLFAIAPAVAATGALGLSGPTRTQLGFIAHEMWAGFWLWGYPFTTLAIAAVPAALLAYGRDRADGRVRAWAPLLALVASWLQPWQGATLIAILVAAEALRLLGPLHGDEPQPPAAQVRRVLAPLAVTVAAGLLPLVYYWALSRWDPSWAIARTLNLRDAAVWWRALVVAALPLGALALLALRIRPVTFQDLALRVWPVVAIGLYVLIAVAKVGTYPPHALQGLAIPLAALAVLGVAGVRWPVPRAVAAWLAVAALAALIVPGTVDELRRSRRDADTARIPFFNTSDEEDALDALARDPRPGGVLGPLRIGYQVPSRMRRRVWLGGGSWTPDWYRRIALGEALFGGALPPAQARALVRSTGARFLISDCRGRADLRRTLAPVLESVRRFGCATLYVVRRP